MRAFQSVRATAAQHRTNEHGGRGAIVFRRLLEHTDFTAPVDFVDFTVVAPGSTIGRHRHSGNEEIYFVVSGTPLMRVDGREERLHRGCLAVVHDGGSHELINDTDAAVEILVIQVRA